MNIKRLKDIGCYRGRRHIMVSNRPIRSSAQCASTDALLACLACLCRASC